MNLSNKGDSRPLIKVERRGRLFCAAALVLLLIFGAAKVISALGGAAILSVPDPVFGVSRRVLLLSVGTLEFMVVGIIVLQQALPKRLYSLLMLCAAFGLYRLALVINNIDKPCPCLGGLTDAIGLSAKVADRLSLSVLAYLSLGSVWILWNLRKASRFEAATRYSTRTISKLTPLSIGTGCILSALSYNAAAAQLTPIVIEGELLLDSRAPTPGGLVVKTTNRFSAHLQGCRFALEVINPGKGIERNGYCFDGTNYYATTVFDPANISTNVVRVRGEESTSVPLKTPKKPFNPATTHILSTKFPPPHAPHILPIWFAFGAKCFLEENAGQVRLPSIVYMGNPILHPSQNVKASWRLTDAGAFPSSYTDYWDDDHFPGSGAKCSGLTNLSFHVSNFKSFEGIQIPTTFSLCRYLFNADGNPQYFINFEFTGIVTNVYVERSSPHPGKILTNTLIYDYTRANSPTDQPLVYTAKRAQLATASELDALESKNYERNRPIAKNFAKLLGWTAGILAAGIPIYFLAVVRLRGRGKSTE